MLNLKSKFFIAVGTALVLLSLAGSAWFLAELLGLRLDSFEDWEKSQADSGFIPLSVPLAVGENSSLEVIPSLQPLPVLPSATPDQDSPSEQSSFAEDLQATPKVEKVRPAVIPTRLIIPSIQLDAPVVPIKAKQTRIGGEVYEQWEAPNKFAVGWYTGSAVLGQVGNSVFVGHHNVYGKVFENLHKVQVSDEIVLIGGKIGFRYQVVNVMILPERNADLKTRLENARWILPSEDERITLVTCWPEWSNTHRLIVVARPMGDSFTIDEDQTFEQTADPNSY